MKKNHYQLQISSETTNLQENKLKREEKRKKRQNQESFR